MRILLTLLISLGITSPVAAKTHWRAKVKANALKAKADAAYVNESWVEALAFLDEAYALDPRPGLIANQGLVLVKMEDYPRAVAAFRRFLATNPPAKKAARALSEIKRIEPPLRVESKPPGATVRLAGATTSLGRTPLRSRLVIGQHELVIELKGYPAKTVPVEVLSGTETKIAVSFITQPVKPKRPRRPQAAAVPLPVITGSVEPAHPGRARTKWGWVALGLGGVAAGGAVTAYVLGTAEIDDRDGAKDRAVWDAHQDTARLWNQVLLGSTAAALVGISMGVTLLAVGDSSELEASVGPGGMSLGGRF